MKLSKEQITKIDTYLEENGVKYWDVRLEMIDHLASKLEKQKGIVLSKNLLIKEFGSSISLEKTIEIKRKSINKKYRKLFSQEVLIFFKSTKNILMFFVFSFLYFQIFKELNTKVFLKLSVTIALIPPIISALFQFYIWIKKNKSIYLATALFYFMFSFLLYNMIIQLTIHDLIFKFSQQTQGKIILFSFPLYLVGMYSGFKVFYKTHKEYTRIYKELQSI